MDQLANIIGIGLFMTLVGWKIIRPYLTYRDVVSGAVTSDALNFMFLQGAIGSGIAIYWASSIGFRSLWDWTIFIAFLLMGSVSLFFGVKTWIWTKQHKKVEPGNGEVRETPAENLND